MSLISYIQLCELVEQGVIDANPDNINAASIDIALGDEIMVEDPLDSPNLRVDLKAKQSLNMTKVTIPEEGYLLRPGQFILATSNETFNLPNNIACEYKLKSSLARSGLQHMLAGWCDPGWNNSKLTLEFKNVSQYHGLVIKPGMKIGQMVFFGCKHVPEENSYATKGQYNNQETVTENKGVR